MKNNLILQFGITFLVILLAWVVPYELEIRGIVTTQFSKVVGIVVFLGAALYWLIRYAVQEKWFRK